MSTTVTAGVEMLMGRKSILWFCGIPIDDPDVVRDIAPDGSIGDRNGRATSTHAVASVKSVNGARNK
jgi:hypothetical protein